MATRRRPGSRIALIAACSLLAVTALATLSPAEISVDTVFRIPGLPLPPAAKKAHEVWKRTEKLNKNTQACLESGGSADECVAQALLCDLQEQAINRYLSNLGPTAALIKKLKIFDSFKLACDGKCYWCCLTPTGCHSSFGPSPVINCNDRYGAGSRTLGYTLIVGKAVGACLGIPQTCDSYAQCRLAGAKAYPGGTLPAPVDPFLPRPALDFGYVTPPASGAAGGCALAPDYNPPADRRGLQASMDVDINHFVMQQKFRAFTDSVARKVADFLDRLPADFPLDEVQDLLSFRGCKGYSQLVNVEPWSGAPDVFKVQARSPEVAAQVAARRALRFVATLRILAGVPNLYQRFAYVESQLWSCQAREDYLRQAGLPDTAAAERALRETLSPAALRILKAVDGLQDYRLLAVPLPGEEAPAPRSYDGCELGSPPQLALQAAPDGTGAALALQVAVTDVDGTDADRAAPLPLSIDWGDGAVTAHSHSGAGGRFTHSYAAPGVYRVIAEAAGVSGLRGAAGLVVEVKQGGGAAPLPAFHRVTLPRVQVYSESTGDEGVVGLGLELGGADPAALPLGRSERAQIVNKQAAPMMTSGYADLGDVIGYNGERQAAARLVLRPVRSGGGASFRDARKVWLVLPAEVVLDLYSLKAAAPLTHRAALGAAAVRAYYNDAPDKAVALAPVPGDAAGRLRAPLLPASHATGRDPAKELSRIEIDVQPLLTGVDLGRLDLSPQAVGRTASFREVTPNRLVMDGGDGAEGGCSCAVLPRRRAF